MSLFLLFRSFNKNKRAPQTRVMRRLHLDPSICPNPPSVGKDPCENEWLAQIKLDLQSAADDLGSPVIPNGGGFNVNVVTKFAVPSPALQETLKIAVKALLSTQTKVVDATVVNLKLKGSALQKPSPPTSTSSFSDGRQRESNCLSRSIHCLRSTWTSGS
jgi:hypothetical protein